MKITIEAEEIMILTKGSDAGKYLIKGTLVENEPSLTQHSVIPQYTCKWQRCKKSPHIVINPHDNSSEDEGRETCHECGQKIEVV